ncbi:tRNA (guanosine(46)-N7)-methyltransferase TrmB [Jeotgalibaca sp. PTS2502]|uniref:tRNA (guanosine(46)-N7)-methyltransferase TrmB n=1 Tax=Jeotgalibaca sp. PTS2502 TaxID=1903686 RepID=UPI0009738AC6|nr:tRNA (guanosine(46)-N7)-methyltransferase TrmB [Jeotgalibaca sp. PTS2502]APZ49169.1 tRNA (guanosine(46)-N7)-methyltransferase TrmB [Jeotgalibaca sp. PTS2502]
MRVRNKPWAADKLAEHTNYVVTNPEALKGKWNDHFEKSQPIHIEVGSGKGQFIVGMAKQNPDINYIGIERQTSVAVMALDKILESELPNVKLLNTDGGLISDYFEAGEVDRVYLNFSDPWPKYKHEKRRLTYRSFLENYQTILKANGEVHFKTDNQGLFEYSLGSFSQYGMVLNQVWLDLHASDYEVNVRTEYEEKFAAKGQPIYRVEAQFKD